MTTKSPSTEEPIEEQNGIHESITQVGQESTSKNIPLWLYGVVVVLLVLIVLSMSSTDKNKEQKSEISFTNEEYKVRNAPTPVTQPPEPIRSPQIKKPLPTTVMIEPEITAEERYQERKARELAEKRKRAPLVLVNKKDNAASNYTSSLRNDADRRIAELQANTQNTLDSLSSGSTEDAHIEPASIETPEVKTVMAGFIKDRSFKLLQGKIIPAVLETAINSDLPGMLRATVSESVYSEDGRIILVPKGARLIGEYRSGITQGQTRVFVIWSRMLRPDGIDIKIDSPGTDSLGRSGLTGVVDSHFMKRFGSSMLLSIIGGYAQQESEEGIRREAFADSFNRSAEIALENSIGIPPTIKVHQGERINVFVAKDLNFKQAIMLSERHKKASS